MGIITALRADDKKKQTNVFVDGSFAFAVIGEIAAIACLEVGQHLSADQIEGLKQSSLFQKCFDAALHYLSYRPRSETEVRQRLHRRGFDNRVIDEVIAGLKEQKLIDDVAFAQYWKNNRMSFRPRSKRLIELELRQKGVAAKTANEVLDCLDDENSAYEAGLKKACLLTGSEYSEFRRRLSTYLRQRGFDYETISYAIERLWQDRQTSSL